MGRELGQRLEGQRPRRAHVSLHEPTGEHAVVRPFGEEVVATTPLSKPALDVADVAVVCDRPDAAATALLREAATRIPVVDLTGDLAGTPIEARRGARIVGLGPGVYASPSASSLLAAALARAAREAGARGPVVMTILEPVSEAGREAVDEMFQQAVSLLNFSALPTRVFGRQVVHDVVSPGLGGREREARLRREIEALCGERVPLLVLSPGLFHGMAVAARAEVDASAWRARLAAHAGLLLSGADEEAASPVSAVKQECASIGRVEPDEAGGAWAWAAADSLTCGSVGNAFALFSEISS
jgi:aspartate-semialdehyde dehydrogenase